MELYRASLNRESTISWFKQEDIRQRIRLTLYLARKELEMHEIELDRILYKDSNIPKEIIDKALGSKTGSVLFFYGDKDYILVIPPFHIERSEILHGCHLETLIAILFRNRNIGILLIRLGKYAFGLFKGYEMITCKIGTGLVHSRHKKGGASQRRYERHREKQIEIFFTRICEHIEEKFTPFQSDVDYIVFGGERNTVNKFIESCDFLKDNCDKFMSRMLNIRYPSQEGLIEAIRQTYAVEILSTLQIKSI